MSEATRKGLEAAADVLAIAMRAVAVIKTRTGAAAVNVAWEADDSVRIRAGKPEGRYGWEPIVPLMFEDNKRHPLWGNRSHWYHQGEYSITGLTLAAALDEAVEAFAEEAVPALLDECGF